MVCQEYTRSGSLEGYINYISLVDVELRAKNNNTLNMVIEVDSGATITLLPLSVADILDISLKSGKKITLTGVGGGQLNAYIHYLDIIFGDTVTMSNIPVAIADSEQVPALLGRLGIYDQRNILMENVDLKATCIDGAGQVVHPPPTGTVEPLSFSAILIATAIVAASLIGISMIVR